MKTVAKIIAYLVWFAFSLGLSVLFFLLVMRIENRVGIFSEMRFWIILVSWFGFVVMMAWLPVWATRKRVSDSARLMAKTATFLIILLACTIFYTEIWGNFVDGKLYNCTDSIPFGFLHPGDWVHSHDGISVEVVPIINPSDPMDKPDTIKEGWSIPKLWLLWWAFAFASVAISALLTFLIFRSRKSKIAQAISP